MQGGSFFAVSAFDRTVLFRIDVPEPFCDPNGLVKFDQLPHFFLDITGGTVYFCLLLSMKKRLLSKEGFESKDTESKDTVGRQRSDHQAEKLS